MFVFLVLSNVLVKGEVFKGLFILCFFIYIGDNFESFIYYKLEVFWLFVKGGGVGGYWLVVCGVSDKVLGIILFLKVVDSLMIVYK